MKSTVNSFIAEECYESGHKSYTAATEAEQNDDPQYTIDNCWSAAAIDFWFALTMGHEKAPFALSKCFGQGVGVPKNPYLEQLLFGVALKLTPKICDQIPAEEKPTIPESIQPAIDALVKLMEDTQAQLPKSGIDAIKFNAQLTKFNHAIKLPSGKKIQSLFTEKTTAAPPDDDNQPSTSPEAWAFISANPIPKSGTNYENIQIKTPAIIFKVAISLFGTALSFQQPAHEFLNDAKPFFREALALGKHEAAVYLACISIIKGLYKEAKLYLATGALLENTLCCEILDSNPKAIDNLTTLLKVNSKTIGNLIDFLQNNPTKESYVEALCQVTHLPDKIKENQQKYSDEDTRLTEKNIQEVLNNCKRTDPSGIIIQTDFGSVGASCIPHDPHQQHQVYPIHQRLHEVPAIGETREDGTSCPSKYCVIL